MITNLFPHNQEAYEKAMAHYNSGHNRAAVVQPTGTGKSFVGGAIASHFKKVLVVAPNNIVLKQAVSSTPHAETMTYIMLSKLDVMPTGYDLIWFDEFHRMGAETWQKGCERIIEANPDAKILGTTATKERYLQQRDMADEFFQGDIVHLLTLGDAWCNHILRVPKYVIGTITMSDMHSDYKSRIYSTPRLNAEQKAKATAKLDNIVLDWSKSYGVAQIFEKYIDKSISRMIVFAQTISKLDEIRRSLPMWFAQAGVKLADIYAVHSSMSQKEVEEQMEAFEADEREGVKLLLSVDMVNEGLHKESIDGVILFRSTISKNLYLQQIGRCFSVGQKRQPLILDLADNFSKANGYEGIYEAKDRYESAKHQNTEDSDSKWDDTFEIIDTLKETREVIDELGKQIAYHRHLTLEQCIESGKKYATRVSFQRGDVHAYRCTIRNGWQDIVMAHMPKPKRWTDEELIEEARKYSTRKEMEQNNPGAYTVINHRKLGSIAFAHMKTLQHQWTKEEVAQEALKYDNLNDFKKNSFCAYAWAYNHKCMDELTTHMKKKIRWNDELVREVASTCSSRREFMDKYPGAYNYAYTRKIVDDVCSHMPKLHKWTLAECKKIALQYPNPSSMSSGNPKAYDAIISHKWEDECFAHMTHRRKHPFTTKEACIAEARKYTKRADFQKYSGTAFRSAKRNGWIDECQAHMPDLRETRYTHDIVIAEAKKYTNIKAFRKAEPYYRAAKRNNWLEEIEKIYENNH